MAKENASEKKATSVARRSKRSLGEKEPKASAHSTEPPPKPLRLRHTSNIEPCWAAVYVSSGAEPSMRSADQERRQSALATLRAEVEQRHSEIRSFRRVVLRSDGANPYSPICVAQYRLKDIPALKAGEWEGLLYFDGEGWMLLANPNPSLERLHFLREKLLSRAWAGREPYASQTNRIPNVLDADPLAWTQGVSRQAMDDMIGRFAEIDQEAEEYLARPENSSETRAYAERIRHQITKLFRALTSGQVDFAVLKAVRIGEDLGRMRGQEGRLAAVQGEVFREQRQGRRKSTVVDPLDKYLEVYGRDFVEKAGRLPDAKECWAHLEGKPVIWHKACIRGFEQGKLVLANGKGRAWRTFRNHWTRIRQSLSGSK